ncbi:hypothetical protein [Nocardia callitridis]|uniref:Uncharacterized protein n=1 Tax=Nocardia callitridis TaxID=648753 RepID=A0ABP9KUQ8_9NOCA
MRRLAGLRRRPQQQTPAPTNTAGPASVSDPSVDPPIVAALVRPLLELRAALGSGVGVPNQAATTALSSATAQTADTEAPHRDGLHALESTWTSRGAGAAVPALRNTHTEIGEISDRGPQYLAVLGDAHATSARAARNVDKIIADFRSDAREIIGNASSAPDTDAVIERGAQALRDALTAVNSARTEMSDHTRRLDEMGPLTVTKPVALSDDSDTFDFGDSDSSGDSSSFGGSDTTTSSFGAPRTFAQPGAPTQFAPGGLPAGTGQPMDPALMAQMQLQQQMVAAGVKLGSTAISAGVDIGTHIIDKIAEVGTHTIDKVAAAADKAIPELINPGSTKNGENGKDPKSENALFDFGGDAGGSTNSDKPAPGTDSGDSNSTQDREPALVPPKPQFRPAPAPSLPFHAEEPATPPAPKPQEPAAPAPHGGMVVPPTPPSGGDQEHKPREGQLGVTVPSAATSVAPVVGEFDLDDDEL